MVNTQPWRRSKQALFISFFLLFPINTFPMNFVKDYFSEKRDESNETEKTPSISPSPHQEDDVVNWEDVISSNDNTQVRRPVYEKAQVPGSHFPSRERDLLPQELVDSCKENMPPLLQGIHAYLQSPDSQNPETQIPSFHRFLLIGPPGTSKSTTLEAMVQDLGLKKDTIFEASEFLGEYRGQTAINVRTLFEKLKFTKERKMLVINEMHKLVEDHANTHTDHKVNAHTIWSNFDYFERNNPNLIIAGSANSGTDLPPELKSRFRVQYVYMPLLDGKRWISGLRPALARRKNVQLANDIKFPVNNVKPGKEEVSTSNKNTSRENTDDLQDLMNKGLSFRDRELVIDAATIFAYKNSNRSKDGALIINNNHCRQALDQFVDKNKVLHFDAEKLTDEERQEKYHKESLEQQDFHFVQQQKIHIALQGGQVSATKGEHYSTTTSSLTNEAKKEALGHISDYQEHIYSERMARNQGNAQKDINALIKKKEEEEKRRKEAQEGCSLQ